MPVITAILLALLLGGWNVHGAPQTPNGYALLNIGAIDVNSHTYINLLKGAYSFIASPQAANSGNVNLGNLDQYGYPVNTTGWTNAASNFNTGPFYNVGTTGPFIVMWSVNRTFAFVVNVNSTIATNCANGATVTGGSSSAITVQTALGGSTIATCGGYPLPAGIGGALVFSFSSSPSATISIPLYFPQTGTYAPLANGVAGTANDLAVIYASNAVAFAGGQIFAPEFLATSKALNPKTIRPMGLTNNSGQFSNESLWKYRTVPAQLNYGPDGAHYPPGVIDSDTSSGVVGYIPSAGATTYPTSVDQYVAAGAPDTPTSWTDGEVLIGYFINQPTYISISGAAKCAANTDVCLTVSSTATLANNQPVWISNVSGTLEANSLMANGLQPTIITVVDSTHIDLQNVVFTNAYSGSTTGAVTTQTINVAGRGAKFIADPYGFGLLSQGSGDGPNAANDLVTLTYDAKLNVMKSSPRFSQGNGIIWAHPWEVLANLANSVHANLWVNIPGWATDDYVTNLAELMLVNLTSTEALYVEYSNEVWNGSWYVTDWTAQVGLVYGLPPGNAETTYGYYGKRTIEIAADFVTAGWTNPQTATQRFRPMIMNQGVANASSSQLYRFNGTDLGATPTGTITGISSGSATPTITINALAGGVSYRNGQGLVISGVTGTGCSAINGTWFTHGGTNTTFVLQAAPQTGTAGNTPIPIPNLTSCSYSGGGTTVPLYNSQGNANYSASPNRPIDLAYGIGYAIYYAGPNFNGSSGGLNVAAANGYLVSQAATDWVAGNYAAALAILDNDVRQGTCASISGSNCAGTDATANVVTFTCPASGTTVTASNSFANGQFIVFTTTGTTCTGLALNTPYCTASVSGSNFKVVPVLAPASYSVASNSPCGSTPITFSGGGTGTQTVGVTIEPSLMWFNANIYSQWEYLASTYDSGRTTPLTVEQYEAGLSLVPPSISQCTTMGMSATSTTPTFQTSSSNVIWASNPLQTGDRVSFTTSGSMPTGVTSGTTYFVEGATSSGFNLAAQYYGTYGGPPTNITVSSTGSGTFTATYCQGIDNLIDAYRGSAANYVNTDGSAIAQEAFNQFMGLDAATWNYGLYSHSRTPAWLALTGPSEWSLLQGDVTLTYPPFQTYYGFAAFRSAYP